MGKDLLSTLHWVRPGTSTPGLAGFAAPPMTPSTDSTRSTIERIGLPEEIARTRIALPADADR
jgi:hypothetical protein